MAPRLSGQNYKFVKFLLSLNSQGDLDTKKTPNIEVCSESLGAMWEYWDIERGLLAPIEDNVDHPFLFEQIFMPWTKFRQFSTFHL